MSTEKAKILSGVEILPGSLFFKLFSYSAILMKAPDFEPNLTEYKMAQIGPFYIRLFCVFSRIRDLTGISYDNYR
jgi:hypothetical protein